MNAEDKEKFIKWIHSQEGMKDTFATLATLCNSLAIVHFTSMSLLTFSLDKLATQATHEEYLRGMQAAAGEILDAAVKGAALSFNKDINSKSPFPSPSSIRIDRMFMMGAYAALEFTSQKLAQALRRYDEISPALLKKISPTL